MNNLPWIKNEEEQKWVKRGLVDQVQLSKEDASGLGPNRWDMDLWSLDYGLLFVHEELGMFDSDYENHFLIVREKVSLTYDWKSKKWWLIMLSNCKKIEFLYTKT